MKKFNFLILMFVFFIFGCNSNYVPYKYIDNIISMSGAYCKQSELLNCESYYACVSEKYELVKSKSPWNLGASRIIIIRGSPDIMKKNDYSNLIKNSYGLLNLKSPNFNDLDLSIGVSYFIYAHNSCASITGDKTYNIDSYMPLLREKLGIK